jgi:lectin, mannose-binding 2
MSSRWFDFGGDTIIRADKYIRLASDAPSKSGWIFSRIPLTATNWEIEFEFAIHGKGHLHGDGFALWITNQRAQPGNVFGHTDQFEGLGIFFDTYKNNRPGVVFPYVMGMMGDGKTTYDSANDGKANEIGGCSVRPTMQSKGTRANVHRHEDCEVQLSPRKPNSHTFKTSPSRYNYSTRHRMLGSTVSPSHRLPVNH